MENLGMNSDFWSGKRVFVTGHTGFKGSWLSLWLNSLGAEVTGYSLEPSTNPSLFEVAEIGSRLHSVIADVRDSDCLLKEIQLAQPEIVLHLAAQPLVRQSYLNPIETYATNVMGTVHLMDAVRKSDGIRVVINVTSDKCYENREWERGYHENDSMGGYDPYSSSKGCSELVTTAFRSSFFNNDDFDKHRVAIASARAGNVIGGGDWAADRLVPDIFRAVSSRRSVEVRNPDAVRPWQHVLEPLSGYMQLAQNMWEYGPKFTGAWNFGPRIEDCKPVSWLVQELVDSWGGDARWHLDKSHHPHEAHYLKLDCSKASALLNWSPRLSLRDTIQLTVDWHKAFLSKEAVQETCLNQIAYYSELPSIP